MQIKNIIEPGFLPAITVKLNGVRGFLLITKNGIYLYTPPDEVYKIGEGNLEYYGTLIDCEIMFLYRDNDYILKVVYGFDLLFNKARDVRDLIFEERHKLLSEIDFSKIELFCDNNDMLFGMLGDIDEEHSGFWWDFYADFLHNLSKEGLTKTFSYYISQISDDKEIINWLNSNEDEVDKLLIWAEEYLNSLDMEIN